MKTVQYFKVYYFTSDGYKASMRVRRAIDLFKILGSVCFYKVERYYLDVDFVVKSEEISPVGMLYGFDD